jgi:plastocyanin
MRTGPLVGFVALVVSGALACGGGGGGSSTPTPTSPTSPSTPTPVTPSTPASPAAVTVNNNSFSPATTTVAPGSTVQWTWDTCSDTQDPYTGTGGQTCVDHSIVWDAGGTPSPTQNKGTYQRTFDAQGTYNYHCAIHGAAMSGKVVVQ